MRLLYAVHGIPPDRRAGVELYTDSVAREMSRRGHAVAVVTRALDRAGVRVESRGSYDAIVIGVPRRKRRFLDLYEDPRIDGAFRRILAERQPDLVHIQHFLGLSLGLCREASAARVPVALTLHDFWLGCPRGQRVRADLALCSTVDRAICASCLRPEWQGIPRDPAAPLRVLRNLLANPAARILESYDRLVRETLTRASLVLTPTEWYRNEYVRWYGLDPARTHALPPGMPQELPARVRPRKKEGTPFVVGYIGSVIPTKGVHVLVEAFAGIADPGFELRIHGKVLPFFGMKRGYQARLDRIASRSLNPVRFEGAYRGEDLELILGAMDLLVVPSLYCESYSLSLREGRMAGLPVIASRLGALAEAVRDEETGILVEPGDATALREAIRRIAEDRALAERLGRAPRPAMPSAAEHAGQLAKLYARALASLGRGPSAADEPSTGA